MSEQLAFSDNAGVRFSFLPWYESPKSNFTCHNISIPASVFVDQRVSDRHHETVVTDQHALAAHTHWHKVTNGVWLNHLLQQDSEYGVSGVLLEVREQDCAKTQWNLNATSSCFVIIQFLHRFMETLVEFEVTKLACMQFEVRVLQERRHLCIADDSLRLLTPEEGQLLHMLSEPISSSARGLGRIAFSELLSGAGGVVCRETGRKTHAQEFRQKTYVGDSVQNICADSRRPLLYSAWSTALASDRSLIKFRRDAYSPKL